MIKYLSIFFLLITTNSIAQSSTESAPASKKVIKYLDEICRIIKTNSLFADSINWESLERKIKLHSKGMNSIDDCRPVIDTIIMTLRRAGDNHSELYSKEAAKKLRRGGQENQLPDSRYLDGGIGYLKIPGFISMNLPENEKFASSIQNQVKQLDEAYNINGWIIDLRGNTGGNMHPMIKGLTCIIGDGIYAYLVSPKQQAALTTLDKQTAYIKLENEYRIKNPSCKVAVLIDSMTASSGEFTAIALKSLSNVRFFGQASAGYTTSNRTFSLSDDSYLFLATAYMADKHLNQYLPRIIPDVVTQNHTDNKVDITIETAKKWLEIK
jgi:carboxyl-terminal processing protease